MINRSQLGKTTMETKRKKIIKGHDRKLANKRPRPLSAGEKRVMARETKAAKTIIKNVKKYSQKNPKVSPVSPLEKKKGKGPIRGRKTLFKVRKKQN
jgi:hypothetical protein|tara:strand:+ start:52 stop:342 length:291 start_codon:yes stop_codon:yes gene_type:complete